MFIQLTGDITETKKKACHIFSIKLVQTLIRLMKINYRVPDSPSPFLYMVRTILERSWILVVVLKIR